MHEFAIAQIVEITRRRHAGATIQPIPPLVLEEALLDMADTIKELRAELAGARPPAQAA